MRTAKAISVLIFCVTFLSIIPACSTEHKAISGNTQIVAPPQPVNAYLPGNNFIFGDKKPDDKVDIGLLVYIKEIQLYSTVVEGLWEKYWYFIKCGVIENTIGQYKDKELNFVCSDGWPTPESGIKLNKAPFPYLKGRVFCFWLKFAGDQNIIVGQEGRIPIRPYEKLNRPRWSLDEPIQKEKFDKICKAVAEVLGSGISVIHEGNDYYIVEKVTWDNETGSSQFALVDKKTYKASLLPDDQIENFDKQTSGSLENNDRYASFKNRFERTLQHSTIGIEQANFRWEDVPALLQLAESTEVLEKFPHVVWSSYMQIKCIKGMIALWYIEAIRLRQAYLTVTGKEISINNFLSLNPMCIREDVPLKEQKTSTEIHQEVLKAYQQWWKDVSEIGKNKAAFINPLKKTGLKWFGSTEWRVKEKMNVGQKLGLMLETWMQGWLVSPGSNSQWYTSNTATQPATLEMTYYIDNIEHTIDVYPHTEMIFVQITK